MTNKQLEDLWIPVEKEDPKVERWYAVTTEGFYRHRIRSAFWNGEHWYGNFADRIIAWSPLEPYKEEVKENDPGK